MSISYIKIGWSYLTGGAGKVADYLLDLVNEAIDKIDPGRKDTISAVINTAMKAMGILDSIAWLIPTRWQRAYRHTLDALECTIMILDDFTITENELKAARDKYALAVKTWKDPDDPTCVTLEDILVKD